MEVNFFVAGHYGDLDVKGFLLFPYLFISISYITPADNTSGLLFFLRKPS